MKKVLILTSVKTGFGHRASANAIEKKLKDKGYETKQLDVFPLMGKMGMLMENSYIPLTTKAPHIYFLCQRVSEYFPLFIHAQMCFRIRKNLLREIETFQPDLILSVHCMFTRAISYLIKKEKLNIPFYIGVVDLMYPPKVWEDKEADAIFVPTDEIYEDYRKKGFSKDRVVVSGFPIRDDIVAKDEAVRKRDHLHLLMINPSTDLKKNIRFALEASKAENTRIDFVCGLDERLYETLKQLQEEGKIGNNVTIHNFVSNVNELLYESDVVLAKAGPNIITEALYSATPIVITGHIKGQENYNYRYVTEHGFGVKCEDPGKISKVLEDLTNGDLEKYRQIIIAHKIKNGADSIAAYIDSHI
ncbi:MAG: hypothetical protein IJI44_00460 [Erysipelotrichaceae bacterium]|nr:hypothetical protein [Erysipelotrichaceae bacterium]